MSGREGIEVAMVSATKVDFNYIMRIEGVPDIAGSDSVLIRGDSPSHGEVKEAVEEYLIEKAVSHLGKSEEFSIEMSVDVTKKSKLTTKFNISPRSL